MSLRHPVSCAIEAQELVFAFTVGLKKHTYLGCAMHLTKQTAMRRWAAVLTLNLRDTTRLLHGVAQLKKACHTRIDGCRCVRAI